jgi:2-dehydropantoate 2-reductase
MTSRLRAPACATNRTLAAGQERDARPHEAQVWPHATPLVAARTLPVALIDGTLEEHLWRGALVRKFPTSLVLGCLWPGIGFGFWLLAPMAADPGAYGTSGVALRKGIIMKTLVYGAGPLGSWIAGKLHGAGVEVSLLARGQRLAELREHGVVLEDAFSGAREIHRVNVVEALEGDDPYDLVLVVMRKDRSDDVVGTLAANRHAHTVVFMQNNPSGFDAYAAALGAERVMAGFPVAGGVRRGHVTRIMPLAPMPMPVGEIDGRVTERTQRVADLLRRTGKRVEIRRDMDAWLVTHVPAILAFGGLFAVDLDPERFARTRDAMVLGVRAREEALAAQEAAGIPIRPAWFKGLPWVPEPAAVAMLRGMAGTALFEVGVEGHARAARGEMIHMMEAYRERVAPGGHPTPYVSRLIEHAHGTRPPLPDGSRRMALRWDKALALGGAAALAAALALGRRRSRD